MNNLTKSDLIYKILHKKDSLIPKLEQVSAYASASIALCKYWGKANIELNIPKTSSISVPLTGLGATSFVKINKTLTKHKIQIEDKAIDENAIWGLKLIDFINLFIAPNAHYRFAINIKLDIPVFAGISSSSCIYASLVKSFCKLYNWDIDNKHLSILARLGSGSAARAIYENQFVEYLSDRTIGDGMDSYALPIARHPKLDDLRIALIIVTNQKKGLSSSEAMQQNVNNSVFYQKWLEQNSEDFNNLKKYINSGSFLEMAQISEANSLRLHSLMLSSNPAIMYFEPETISVIKKIWKIRNETEKPIFFTQDAGPNIKILFKKDEIEIIRNSFPDAQIIEIFRKNSTTKSINS